jgi:short subunit fatty acids transporter
MVFLNSGQVTIVIRSTSGTWSIQGKEKLKSISPFSSLPGSSSSIIFVISVVADNGSGPLYWSQFSSSSLFIDLTDVGGSVS